MDLRRGRRKLRRHHDQVQPGLHIGLPRPSSSGSEGAGEPATRKVKPLRDTAGVLGLGRQRHCLDRGRPKRPKLLADKIRRPSRTPGFLRRLGRKVPIDSRARAIEHAAPARAVNSPISKARRNRTSRCAGAIRFRFTSAAAASTSANLAGACSDGRGEPGPQQRFLLRCRLSPYELTVFADGRAIVKGTQDPAVARSIYARYISA